MNSPKIKVVVASGSEELTPRLIERVRAIYPELPLYVVAEFPPPEGNWIPYHIQRGFRENLARARVMLEGKSVRISAVLFEPKQPYGRMRLLGFLLSPIYFAAFNHNLDHFMLRPRSLPHILGHFLWRLRERLVFEFNPGGNLYTFVWRLGHPKHLRRPLRYFFAVESGRIGTMVKRLLPPREDPPEESPLPEGISVVIPSRDGKHLLARLLPGLLRELESISSEVIVVDNGSTDGSAEYLRATYPRVLVAEHAAPLAFAEGVNHGIRRARYGHVCLLNNDMVIEPGFFTHLRRAFDEVPDLFCSTAQILFPPGLRRQETGKAAMPPRDPASRSTEFPVRCETPTEGEDLSYVLYGSGGCSLYATTKLRQLGGIDEAYKPAYCEDLDIGYRAWLRGWSSVYVSAARVTHDHRATTSRFYTEEALELVLDVNYLRFLMRAVASPQVFHRLWKENIWRLNLAGSGHFPSFIHIAALGFAVRAVRWIRRPPAQAANRAATYRAATVRERWRESGTPGEPPLPNGRGSVGGRGSEPPLSEDLILALGSGDVAVFPGQLRRLPKTILVASPYLPFPLSHGGAVRMFNLMRRAAHDYGQVLVAFADQLATPPPELLAICNEIVLVRRVGSHLRPTTDRPDVVEEFDLPAFRAALRQTVHKWRPAIAQLEFTQMAQYAGDCVPARTILVEHDITFDLLEQLLRLGEDWELRRQYTRWLRFEKDAWCTVDCVVTMSEKDRAVVTGASCTSLANGVDLERFRPAAREPDPARLLFIGSFAHLPNVTAVDFFLREVWPLLAAKAPVLHIIAGSRHRYFLDRYRDRVGVHLNQPGVEVEDFVADVRPAYERATIVVAPLLASAGTNIKIMEAMAMGKAIVSTPAGINGLDLAAGRDVVVASSAAEMAAAILTLLDHPGERRALERQARETVARQYDWDTIAREQRALYDKLSEPRP
ncbi:MAG: glycosyltransferase [Bryobacteraceae bacterium]